MAEPSGWVQGATESEPSVTGWMNCSPGTPWAPAEARSAENRPMSFSTAITWFRSLTDIWFGTIVVRKFAMNVTTSRSPSNVATAATWPRRPRRRQFRLLNAWANSTAVEGTIYPGTPYLVLWAGSLVRASGAPPLRETYLSPSLPVGGTASGVRNRVVGPDRTGPALRR